MRVPGRSPYTSPRKEQDKAQILSGVFEKETTGAPIAILIMNEDVDSSQYEAMKDKLRPGHANYTYLEKYGLFDYRGGGRSSARETACRVAAGCIAKKLLKHFNIQVVAYIKEIGGIGFDEMLLFDLSQIRFQTYQSPIYCPHDTMASAMILKLEKCKNDGDSIGGIVEVVSSDLPVGLGDPIYEKLEANLAKAMLSLPASRGVEFGSGFQSSKMRGSEYNDQFILDAKGKVSTKTNNTGGILGGISNGMPIKFRIAFKPTSSIKIPQETLDRDGKKQEFKLSETSRNDPCVAIRAVPVVEAMTAIVLADALLMNRSAKL